MREFWQFAKLMLFHKKLLLFAIAGALFDAMCGFAGFGVLPWVFKLILNKEVTTASLLEELLNREDIVRWVGDMTWVLEYVPDDKFLGLAELLIAVFLLACIGSLGRVVHQYNVYTVSMSTVMRIRKTVYQRLVHLPMSTIGVDGTADYLSRMVRDCAQLGRGFNALFARSARSALQSIMLITLAFIVSWQLTSIFLLGMPIIALVIYRFGRIVRKASRRALKESAKMVGSIQESLQSSRVVKVHQAEGYERRRFNSINRGMFRAELRGRIARVISSPLVELVALAGVMAVALVAVWIMLHMQEDPDKLVAVLLFLGLLGAQLKPLVNLNNDLQEAAAAATRVNQLLHFEIEPNVRGSSRSHASLPRHSKSVRFDRVTFTYPTADTPALINVDLTVEYGQVCAIVGGNGSGKTTLLSMLPRLFVPGEGRVMIDMHDIQKYSLRSVRNQMAMVIQDTVLFDGTIGENITYGSRHVTEADMIAAAKRAHADEFIRDLPAGYDTQIGEWGSRLSGGQRQRMAIARAIMRDPAILILDEATSQIDADSEASIAEALTEFMAGRTTFIIAHRLSTVVGADMIVVMEAGRIVSIGKHNDLLKQCDIYRTLCQTQLVSID